MVADNKFKESMGKIAIAFNRITGSYEASKLDRFRRSPFDLTQSLQSASLYHLGVDYHDPTEGKLSDFIRATEECFQDLQEAIKIIGFGINYRQYIRFKMMTPTLQFTADGTCHLDYQRVVLPPTREDVLFGIQFCVESYLRLTEFDFQIDPRAFLLEDRKQIIISIANNIIRNDNLEIDEINWEETTSEQKGPKYILVLHEGGNTHKLEFAEEELTKETDTRALFENLKNRIESFFHKILGES